MVQPLVSQNHLQECPQADDIHGRTALFDRIPMASNHGPDPVHQLLTWRCPPQEKQKQLVSAFFDLYCHSWGQGGFRNDPEPPILSPVIDPFQIKFQDFQKIEYWSIRNSYIYNMYIYIYIWTSNFQKIGFYSSGRHFSKSCAPRKMMQNRIDEIFRGQTFKNRPDFDLRAADFWKPLTSDYVAQGCFSPRKNGPRCSEAPNLWVRCSRLFF